MIKENENIRWNVLQTTAAYVLHYLVKGNKASIMDIPKLRNEEEGGVPSY